jgi:hypothetical protein
MNVKRYLVVVFTKKTDFIIPSIEKNVSTNSSYQICTIGTTGFISFLSFESLEVIKNDIYAAHPSTAFLIFNTTEKGINFDLNFDGGDENKKTVEQIFLLEEFPDNKAIINDSDVELELNDLLDLYNKNGWKALTDKQRQQLENYSKEG